ncbi:MAG: RNA polymerase sigma factor [Calditrichia bacterium]|nr:RNA polymerase sigma factor [Calditrichia bacterium]
MEREEIYSQNVDRIYNLLLKMVNSPDDARDLTHDVFVRFFKNEQKFLNLSAVSTYLYKIALNTGINFNSRKKMIFGKGIFSADTREILVSSEEKNAHDKLEEKEFNETLKNHLKDLPENQAKAFYLSKMENMPHKQVGEILSISISSVESLVHRAKKKLAEKFLQKKTKKQK